MKVSTTRVSLLVGASVCPLCQKLHWHVEPLHKEAKREVAPKTGFGLVCIGAELCVTVHSERSAPASPRPARAASPRMARASPATPKAKAISVGVTPGSSKSLHASGKRPPTATKKKAATSKPKAKKALNDEAMVGQSSDGSCPPALPQRRRWR